MQLEHQGRADRSEWCTASTLLRQCTRGPLGWYAGWIIAAEHSALLKDRARTCGRAACPRQAGRGRGSPPSSAACGCCLSLCEAQQGSQLLLPLLAGNPGSPLGAPGLQPLHVTGASAAKAPLGGQDSQAHMQRSGMLTCMTLQSLVVHSNPAGQKCRRDRASQEVQQVGSAPVCPARTGRQWTCL